MSDTRMMNLLTNAIDVAREISDGHLTICRYTTNWRVGFFTPDDTMEHEFMSKGATLEEALSEALINPVTLPSREAVQAKWEALRNDAEERL